MYFKYLTGSEFKQIIISDVDWIELVSGYAVLDKQFKSNHSLARVYYWDLLSGSDGEYSEPQNIMFDNSTGQSFINCTYHINEEKAKQYSLEEGLSRAGLLFKLHLTGRRIKYVLANHGDNSWNGGSNGAYVVGDDGQTVSRYKMNVNQATEYQLIQKIPPQDPIELTGEGIRKLKYQSVC